MRDSSNIEGNLQALMHPQAGSRGSERTAHVHRCTGPADHLHQQSRRDFVHSAALALGVLIEESAMRAVQLRAQSLRYSNRENVFDLEKVADGVYAALPRPQAMINSNAAVFVNTHDVLIVDAHSKPSASAALLAQLRRELTDLPVRYVVNSHFHWDHTQGNSTYRQVYPNVRFVASETTRELMAHNSFDRMKQSLEGIPQQIEDLRKKMAHLDAAGRAFYRDQIAQLQAYQEEMAHFELELPELTFKEELTIHDRAHTLALSFQGRGHTAGDVILFCPEKKVIVTGDVLIGWLPFIADGYPKEWPTTLENISRLGLNTVIPGHGFVDKDHLVLGGMKAYLEELTELVERGRERRQEVKELQQQISAESLTSLGATNYTALVRKALKHFVAWYGTPPNLDDTVRTNVAEIYSRLNSA